MLVLQLQLVLKEGSWSFLYNMFIVFSVIIQGVIDLLWAQIHIVSAMVTQSVTSVVGFMCLNQNSQARGEIVMQREPFVRGRFWSTALLDCEPNWWHTLPVNYDRMFDKIGVINIALSSLSKVAS